MDKNRLAVELFGRYAQRYQEKYMNQDRYQRSLDAFCDYEILPSGSLLELGCGPGNVTQYILDRLPGLELLATDLAPEMLSLAQANNPSIQTQLLDCREISTLEKQFTGIIAAFVLPYLSPKEAKAFINDAAVQLKPDGVLYFSMMSGSASLSGWQGPSDGSADRLYMYYHEEKTLLNYLAEAELEVKYKEQLTIEPGQVEPYDLVLIAQRPLLLN